MTECHRLCVCVALKTIARVCIMFMHITESVKHYSLILTVNGIT
jgi:hypothetical protein